MIASYPLIKAALKVNKMLRSGPPQQSRKPAGLRQAATSGLSVGALCRAPAVCSGLELTCRTWKQRSFDRALAMSSPSRVARTFVAHHSAGYVSCTVRSGQ